MGKLGEVYFADWQAIGNIFLSLWNMDLPLFEFVLFV